ncbi:MAG: LysR family transcriptional regulator [Paracoccaceae bacterium]|nr:LysR family transcriptional regulator [Paracoccaceae bacterium]
MTYQWNDIRVFLAVARAETLSAAGRILKVDPATVGRRVARLEQSLGAPLFAKSSLGYALTDAGMRLMEQAQRIENEMAGLSLDIGGQGTLLKGQIRIGAPDGCANFILPQVCAAISDRHPDLDIQIVALPRVVNLSKREVDMAIAVSPPTTRRLSVQRLADYNLYLAASKEYLKQHNTVKRLSDLKEHRFVGYIADMIFDKELDYLSEIGIERVSLASNSVSVQFNLLRTGAGVGIVHGFALPFAQNIERVLPEVFSLRRSFYLIRHNDNCRIDRMNRFADDLVSSIRLEIDRLDREA